MDQPVQNVTENDVKRIALRDFGDAQVGLALSILDEFGKQKWNRSDPRVHLAILKLANGDLDRLLDATQAAIQDHRDVISAAEHPRYGREIGFDKVSESVKRSVIDDDWRQYCEWLEGKPARRGFSNLPLMGLHL